MANEQVKQATKEERKETVRVDTREDVRTFYFPSDIVKGALDKGVKGFTVSGYEMAGKDLKVFVPADRDNVEAKQLKYNKENPNMLVVSAPANTVFKSYYMEENKKALNGERAVEGPKVSIAALEKIQQEHNPFKGKEAGQSVSQEEKTVAQEAAVEETAQKEALQPDAAAKAGNEEDRPIWVKREAVVSLRDGKGFFIKGFGKDAEGKEQAIFVPKKGDHMSSRMTKNWLMVTADGKDKDGNKVKFDIYRQTGKDSSSYEKTGYWVDRDTVRKNVFRKNQDIEKSQGKLKTAARSDQGQSLGGRGD